VVTRRTSNSDVIGFEFLQHSSLLQFFSNTEQLVLHLNIRTNTTSRIELPHTAVLEATFPGPCPESRVFRDPPPVESRTRAAIAPAPTPRCPYRPETSATYLVLTLPSCPVNPSISLVDRVRDSDSGYDSRFLPSHQPLDFSGVHGLGLRQSLWRTQKKHRHSDKRAFGDRSAKPKSQALPLKDWTKLQGSVEEPRKAVSLSRTDNVRLNHNANSRIPVFQALRAIFSLNQRS
jgi:hypothetical protein